MDQQTHEKLPDIRKYKLSIPKDWHKHMWKQPLEVTSRIQQLMGAACYLALTPSTLVESETFSKMVLLNPQDNLKSRKLISFYKGSKLWLREVVSKCFRWHSLLLKISWTSTQSVYVLCEIAQLCNPMDCSPPGSSVHGILQARILEWVAMPSTRGSSQPLQGSNPHLLHLLH